jgi:succinoglycan biosynthesis transport protein ExoP
MEHATYKKTLADYLELVKRRKHYIIVTWLLVTLAAVIVAYNLPKIYRSTATMLIEAPVPAKLIDAPVSQYGEEQIQSIYQRALSTHNVLSIIEANDLYNEIKDAYTKHELAELFRGNTDVELTASSIAPKAHSQMAEIAFNISFSDSDPDTAQAIAGQLASLFIGQNDKARTQRAIKTAEFLTEETDKLNRELQEIDGKIAQFKEQHPFSLPEQVGGNQAAIDRAENELRDTDNQIRTTKERIAFLSAQLASAQKELPISLDGDAPRSKQALRARYLQYSSIYSPTHPSLLRLKRELEAMDPTFEGQAVRDDVLKQLAKARSELELLQKTYSGTHPDITKLKKQIGSLKKELKQTSAPLQTMQEDEGIQSTNPAYLNIAAQYKSSQSELESLLQKQVYLKARIENLHNVLIQAPQIEMVYTDMIRTRDNIIKKYTQLKEKWQDAKLAQTLEEQHQGQTLTLIEPPVVPRYPEKAIRRKVAIGGFFMGIFAGLGVAFIVEFLEPGIRGYRALQGVTGLMPLVVIPYIESPAELEEQLVKQSHLRKIMVWAACAFSLFAVLIISLSFLGLEQE